MSWDVALLESALPNAPPVEVELHSEGGIYVFGGTTDACLNITYNYSKFYSKYLDDIGLKWLDGRKASDCIERLQAAVDTLGTEREDNYWLATCDNAGYALSILLRWAQQHPDAVFEVT